MNVGICKLCNVETDLKKSHILPEFFYSGIYDEKHRILEITDDSERTIQKGLREDLFCQACETKLSRYEGYAATLIRDIPNFQTDSSGRFIYSENIDYSSFKLFQLSILWRASISKNPDFAQVSLGPHEEKVHQMLIQETPGEPFEYGCIMMTILDPMLIHKVISSPVRVKPKPFGHTVYKFMTGNLTWLFFVTSHSVSAQAQEFFLQDTGLLRIWLAKDEKTLLLSIGKNLKQIEMGRQSL